jgi:acyl-CoA thioesterase FadM
MQVDGIERATFECLLLHFDTKAGRTTALPEAVQAALKAAEVAELPNWAGRKVSLEKQ